MLSLSAVAAQPIKIFITSNILKSDIIPSFKSVNKYKINQVFNLARLSEELGAGFE